MTAFEPLSVTLDRLRQKAEAAMKEVASLPCHGLDDEGAASRCAEMGAAKECRHRQDSTVCPQQRLEDAEVDFQRSLVQAGVPALERGWLMDVRRDRSRLRHTLAMRTMGAVVTRRVFDYEGPEGTAHIRGSESIVVLTGPTGVGKTIAACYALGKLGGRYTRGYTIGSERLTREDRTAFASVSCLVVDQLGRTQDRNSYAAQTIEELVDLRHGERLLTVFVGNFFRVDFEAAFGEVVLSRLAGSGAWVELKGADMRRGDGHGTR